MINAHYTEKSRSLKAIELKRGDYIEIEGDWRIINYIRYSSYGAVLLYFCENWYDSINDYVRLMILQKDTNIDVYRPGIESHGR